MQGVSAGGSQRLSGLFGLADNFITAKQFKAYKSLVVLQL